MKEVEGVPHGEPELESKILRFPVETKITEALGDRRYRTGAGTKQGLAIGMIFLSETRELTIVSVDRDSCIVTGGPVDVGTVVRTRRLER